jgi:Mrp family chromosome partitioning ATPase
VSRLLHQLRDGYDCVVIDGPGLLGAAEARLLAALADKVLLVVKSGDTHWDLARDALNLLRDLGMPGKNCFEFVGAVLTQAEFKKPASRRRSSRKSLGAIHGLISHMPRRGDASTNAGAGDAPSLEAEEVSTPPASRGALDTAKRVAAE